MKKLSSILFLILPLLVLGQINNFNYVQYDSVATLAVNDTTFAALHGEIISLSSTRDSLTITPVEISKPDEWAAYYCPGKVCLPLAFLPAYSFGIAAGDTLDFSFDVECFGVAGDGEWMIMVVDSSTMEIDSAHVQVGFVTTGVDRKRYVPEHFQISNVYPNPVNAQVNFELKIERSGNYLLTLHSITGQAILEKEYMLTSGRNIFSWNVQDLHSGNYLLTVTNGGEIHTRKVVIVK